VAAARDCEAYGSGWLGQPANTVSSLAFVVLAAWFAWRWVGTGESRLGPFAMASLAIGVGSVAFHGPHPPWGQWAHDASIGWALVLAVSFDMGGDRRVGWRSAPIAWLAGSTLVGIAFWFWPDSQRAVFAVLGLAFGLLELAAVRRHARPRPGDPGFWTWVFALGVSAVGAAAFFLGRTAWACEPGSVLQAHAVWHLCLAGAAAAWVTVAVEGVSARSSGDRLSRRLRG
jgi:hypothetical protein